MQRLRGLARALVVAGGFAAAGGALACDLGCFDPACERTGLELSATRADGEALSAGQYEIWVATDEAEFVAHCDLAELADASCAFEAAADTASPSGGQAPSLAVAGDDMPRDIRIEWQHAVKAGAGLELTGPAQLALQIELDGVVLAAAELAPDYASSGPAAASCGTCEHAQVTVELVAP